MQATPFIKQTSRARGFTLIELLTVVAVIGILAGILIPTVGAAKRAALKAQTRAQFSGWAQALESYRGEYGYYPDIGNLATGGELSLNTSADDFIKALSGRQPNGNALSDTDRKALNRKRIGFYSFGEAEHMDAEGNTVEGSLYDAFGNPYISVRVDHDGNGIIESAGPSGSSTTNLHARVAIWSNTNSFTEGEIVKSWD